jgi:hypothetical protein
MNSESEGEYNKWGRDPLSAAIDSQVAGMPDRPQILVAIICYNISAENKLLNHAMLSPFQANRFLEIPFRCFGAIRASVTFGGFDESDAKDFLKFTTTLSELQFGEAAIYKNGTATLRVKKLELVKPENVGL